jgi:uncharacterized protein YjiS (DUF1127 family)
MQNILTHGNSLMSTVNNVVADIWNRHLIRQERRVSYWQLQNMTDRELKDIGVSRCDIRQKIFAQRD